MLLALRSLYESSGAITEEVLGGGIAWPYPDLSQRHWSAPPLRRPIAAPSPVAAVAYANAVYVQAIAGEASATGVGVGSANAVNVQGVAEAASAAGGGVAIATELFALRWVVSRASASGAAVAISPESMQVTGRVLCAQAKGAIEISDEELLAILMEAA